MLISGVFTMGYVREVLLDASLIFGINFLFTLFLYAIC